MKKIIVIAAITIIGIAAYNPELADDGGQNAARAISADYDFESKESCDGLSTRWLPFGRKVEGRAENMLC